MEGGSIQQCNVVPQTERLFESDTDPQIQNRRGGNIYRLDDKKRLLRFLIIGSEQTYYCREKELIRQNADCVDRLIKDGRGVEVVQTIKDISLGGRNVRQNSLLLAYAICARSNDSDTKKAAYKLLSEICRIPTHLFKFIKYCEEESRDEMSDTDSKKSIFRSVCYDKVSKMLAYKSGMPAHIIGTGWGRAHKRAVCKWYTQFERNPEKLARLITKYKTSEQWKHKDVLRLSHTCSKDPVMGFIFSYILNGYMNAIKQYDQALLEMDEETAAKFHKISKLIKVFDDASRCDGVPQLCSLITEYKLTWEQCNRNLLKKKEVWLALLPHMPIEALTRNLGRMSSLEMFAENSEDEQEVVNKLDSINVPTDGVIEGVADEGDDLEDYRPWVTRKSCRHFLHPIKIFIALITYKSGHGDRGNLVWTPNNTICAAMERAFYRAYTALESTGKTFYLSVNVSQSMSQPVQGVTRNISCSTAAAAMLMLTARTEQNCIIKAFCDRAEDLHISPTDTLDEIKTKFSNVQSGPTDCAQPMFDAIDMKRKDIDVFVIFTDNETWWGNVHPQEALCQYREYSGNKNVKLVVCGMSATDFTVADKEDPLMLDIVGFDATTPWLISEFARGSL